MSRTNKKTRIRGLPPKLYLDSVDNKTGSIPTISRTSSDQRTGKYNVSFDDTNTVVFRSASVVESKTTLGSMSPVRYSENDVFEEHGKDFFKSGFSDEHQAVVMFNFNNNVEDKSGNGLNLSVSSGSISYGQGPVFGKSALYLDGSSSLSVSLPSGLLSSATASYTIEAVFKYNPNDTNKLTSFLYSFGSESLGGQNFAYQFVGNEYYLFLSQQAHRLATSFSPWQAVTMDNYDIASYEENKWHHVAYVAEWTQTGSLYNTKFFFDGEHLSSSVNITASLSNVVANSKLRIGDGFYYGSSTNAKFRGHVSDFRVVEKALTNEQIKRSAYRTIYGSDIVIPSGSIVKGIVDSHMSMTPGQEITPYIDSDNPASDGKSTGNAFYATGSLVTDVGEGFDGPVWSKTKIEIDLTPSAEHSFGIENFNSASNNYFMAYWNKDLKQYQGIGSGDEFDLAKYKTTSVNGMRRYLDDKASGFPGCLYGPVFEAGTLARAGQEFPGTYKNAFRPATNFGFPNDTKYQATSSNYIEMSDYIDSDFVVEKMVLVFSGALNVGNYAGITPNTSSVAMSATTFFILNQWNAQEPYKLSTYGASGEPTGSDQVSYYHNQTMQFITQSSPSVYVTSSMITGSVNRSVMRDLVTWTQVMYVNGRTEAIYGNYPTSSMHEGWQEQHQGIFVSSSNWSGKYTISSSIVSPGYYVSGGLIQINGSGSSQGVECILGWPFYGRNMINNRSRNVVNVLESNIENVLSVTLNPTASYFIVNNGADRNLGQFSKFHKINTESVYSKINPYILKPGDQLILGWEVPSALHEQNIFGDRVSWGYNSDPVGSSVYDGAGPKLTFHSSPAKLILYGSKISKGKEHHDTLNQLLTSLSVKEAIE